MGLGGSDPVARQLRQSRTVSSLESMARELLGTSLCVFRAGRDGIEELYPADDSPALPDFCRQFRGTPLGARQCARCRALVHLGACYRGTSEYTLHGGVQVVAAAARAAHAAQTVVVALYAFAHEDKAVGWKRVGEDARGLGLNLGQLRAAYRRLPMLGAKDLATARAIVGAASAAVAELPSWGSSSARRAPSAGRDRSDDLGDLPLEERIARDLHLARERSFQPPREKPGALLVSLVTAMIRREPALPFSVGAVARAARVSPNHFSTMFRQNTGQRFVDFLTDRRIEAARELLRDPTMNVGEAARRCGFDDHAYFCRRFKLKTGMSPRQWRMKG